MIKLAAKPSHVSTRTRGISSFCLCSNVFKLTDLDGLRGRQFCGDYKNDRREDQYSELPRPMDGVIPGEGFLKRH
jgi:hypothetical protein